MPRHPELDKRLPDFTSDHTWLSAEIELLVPGTESESLSTAFTLSGVSWNMMKKCQVHTNFSNNPFKVVEGWQQYEARVAQQLTELKTLAATNQFFLLQETDQLEKERILNNLNGVSGGPWKALYVPKTTDKESLMTLYNSKYLQLIPNTEHSILLDEKGQTKRYRGYEARFKVVQEGKVTDETVTLANLHLGLNEDYSTRINVLQEEHKDRCDTSIMGGDTNHDPKSCQIVGMMLDRNNATSITAQDKNLETGFQQLILKTIDGFFVAPPRSDAQVKMSLEGLEFKLSDDLNKATVKPFEDLTTYVTQVGQPWRSDSNKNEAVASRPRRSLPRGTVLTPLPQKHSHPSKKLVLAQRSAIMNALKYSLAFTVVVISVLLMVSTILLSQHVGVDFFDAVGVTSLVETLGTTLTYVLSAIGLVAGTGLLYQAHSGKLNAQPAQSVREVSRDLEKQCGVEFSGSAGAYGASVVPQPNSSTGDVPDVVDCTDLEKEEAEQQTFFP